MKNFILYSIKLLLITFVLLVSLEFVYSNVYACNYSRSKFQFLRSYNNQFIDYVFLGSSRVENAIIPNQITSLTGKKAVNFGFQAAKLKDVLFLLKMLKEYNITNEKVLIQIDYIYNLEDGYSNILEYNAIPFLKESNNVRAHLSSLDIEKRYLFEFPFIRYALYDQKNGFRELIANLVLKKKIYEKQKGFVKIDEHIADIQMSLPNEIIAENNFLDEITLFAKSNDINVVFYTAPFRSNTKNLNYIQKLSEKIPNLYDFSTAIKDETLFKDGSHLNYNGAVYFTELLTQDILLKE